MRPRVRLEHHVPGPIRQVGVDDPTAEVEGNLGLHIKSDLDGPRPEHRLERVCCAAVGVAQHAPYGACACAPDLDDVELLPSHQP
jgi:hypothetical protein